MIFSHGLAGSRNAYSHIAGSIASHGIVVICPEHRDGSSAITFVRDPSNQNRFFQRSTRTAIPFVRIPHRETPEVSEARDAQLRIRCWELGLIFEAVLGIQEGKGTMANLNTSTPEASLAQFSGKMAVEKPGEVVWAGHSFGATTTVQFLKSTFYASHPSLAAISKPLFKPSSTSRLIQQVTPHNPVILLDMWCFPLLSPSLRPLWALPLPCFAQDYSSAPGGTALLAIESDTFFKWTAHLHTTARALSPDPSAPIVEAQAHESASGTRWPETSMFYVLNSAHLNQSDFGLLFPWLTNKIFGAEEPERALRLNVRAVLQHLRRNGVGVGRTAVGDLVDDRAPVDKLAADAAGPDGIYDDVAIFDKSGENRVEAWRWVDVIGLGEESEKKDKDGDDSQSVAVSGTDSGDEERRMEGEMEPYLAVEDSALPAAVNPTVEVRA
jgi:platelet-activating factor acetylhydrolase